MSETLRATLARLRTLTFAEAYASIVDGDPLGLAARAEAALEAAARWVPVDVVALRCARHLAAALRAVPEAEEQLDAWLQAHLTTALAESRDSNRAAEPREHAAWQRHHQRVAAALGVHDHLGPDAHALFDALPEADRRLALEARRLLQTGRTRDLAPEAWARFNDLWRSLVRRTLEAQAQ